MRFTVALNYIFGSILVIILIFADYARKYNTDARRRGLFLRLLALIFTAMLADFIFCFFNGAGGSETERTALHTVLMVYYASLILAFYHFFIFVDFTVFEDSKRTRIIHTITWLIWVLTLLILFLNINGGFYFYLDEENRFCHGDYYFIFFITGCLPAAFMVYELISARGRFAKRQLVMTLAFVVFIAAGSTVNRFRGTATLIWPCLTAGMLYAYFFIVHHESKIDILTGLGNRHSFDEFIDKLERSKRIKEPYSIVMIDMDRFKKINDTLGHAEGDNALKDMAGIIKACTGGDHDFAARYGGDEFVLAAKPEDIDRIMEQIQREMEALNESRGRPYQLRISYGHDVYTPGSGKSIHDFLGHIDALMYRNKNDRRRAEDQKGEIH
ncbi:MAG: GGDEF domain-containing protein [Treponema sp.]|jgi:diguanylate cyclase (GGDEF)-like protein|nr:GGDEF domain-containing protein [Treponema sp.]